MKAISFQNVTKSFGPKKILNNVSFDLEENMIYGFVGPNGAGKTTTIKMILGLLKFNTGFITIFGKKVNFGRTDSQSTDWLSPRCSRVLRLYDSSRIS